MSDASESDHAVDWTQEPLVWNAVESRVKWVVGMSCGGRRCIWCSFLEVREDAGGLCCDCWLRYKCFCVRGTIHRFSCQCDEDSERFYRVLQKAGLWDDQLLVMTALSTAEDEQQAADAAGAAGLGPAATMPLVRGWKQIYVSLEGADPGQHLHRVVSQTSLAAVGDVCRDCQSFAFSISARNGGVCSNC